LSGIKSVAYFTGASNRFTKANINQDIAESLKTFDSVNWKQLHLRVYISAVWGCPYGEKVPFKRVYDLIDHFLDRGADEISLGDTIGVAIPRRIRDFFKPLKRDKKKMNRIFFHGHDTYGLALANVCEALDCGLENFDSSAGGLGGCPYAPSSAGNLATEDLVYMLNQTGIKTGIDLEKLCDASAYLAQQIGKVPASRVFRSRKNSFISSF
jgi:isopropylmalate/homocitrate/citramalate synthase